MKFKKIIEEVPDYTSFLTVDELDKSTYEILKKYPDIIKVKEIGRSREGHPINCIKIGAGSKNALLFGCPHPNEPIGAMMLEYLISVLSENEEFRESMDYTWYIIKCADPDGTKLNEKWFKGPFNVSNYIKNFYRPAGFNQVEWSFPIDYKNLHFDKPLPETQALMKVIEEIKPDFLYSLHNAGFGGVFWYITHDLKEIYSDLIKIAKENNMPLHLGEPEIPACENFADAIYKMVGAEDIYDFYEQFSDIPPEILYNRGTDSSSYANSFKDCICLMNEMPYFYDPRIEDMSESSMSRRDAIMIGLDYSYKHYKFLKEIVDEVDEYFSMDNPFILLVKENIAAAMSAEQAQKNWALQEEFGRKAKISEVFDNTLIRKFYNALTIGLTVRAIQMEIDRLKGDESISHAQQIAELEKQLSKASEYLDRTCNELENELNYKVIPIQTLVRMQLYSGLIVMDYISRK